MMRDSRRGIATVGAAVAFFCVSILSVAAGTTEDVAAVVGESHGEVWTSEFSTELARLAATSRIADRSYALAARVFHGQRIGGTPDGAARLVFQIVQRVDRELRRGGMPGKVLMDARRAATRLEVGAPLVGESAQLRLRRQLSGMGTLIYGELGQRPGPQSGPGSQGGSAGTGSSGGGLKGRPGSSNEATGEQAPGS